jgi:hypothetical protein
MPDSAEPVRGNLAPTQRPMNVTNEPALGTDCENSDIVFPVARIAIPAIRNATAPGSPSPPRPG